MTTILLAAALLAAEPSSDAPARARFLLTAMKDARERLESGVFRASGEILDEIAGRSIQADWEVYCAFDFPNDAFRFDQKLPTYRSPKHPNDLSVIKYIRTADGSVEWTQGLGPVRLSLKTRNSPPHMELMPFDVRILGFTPRSSIDEGVTLEKAYAFISGWPVHSAQEEGDGIQRIEWVGGESGGFRITLWLNENQGFCPIRFQRQFGHAGAWTDPVLVSEGTWSQIRGVWVPKTFRVEEFKTVYELAFDWESVNEPVPAKLFTPQGLNLDPETLVQDYRLGGKPVVLGTLKTVFEEPAAESPKKKWMAAYWVGTAVLVLAILSLGAVTVRRSLRRT